VDKVKGEQNSLIATLEKQQRKMEEGALLVELFADDVDKCMLVINSALTAGMSWDDIDTMVKAETAKGEYAVQCVDQFGSGSVQK
jgi:orotate phosphoribosyltransferase-like protein